MALSEFTLINQFFKKQFKVNQLALLGIGDDCSILDIPNDKQLAVTTDTLVESVHFLEHTNPFLLGHKSLAVNLSDLAAMGARPAWVTLSLTLPKADKAWIEQFSQGFFSLAQKHAVQLIGGDTTQGPLSIGVTAMGLLPKGQSLKRSGATVGDDIYVSGEIGSAGLGLVKSQKASVDLTDADVIQYQQPMPKVELGEELLTRATSCIDVSDGLLADLSHIVSASCVGAIIFHEDMPLSTSVKSHCMEVADAYWPYATGDDYELCFTLPSALAKDKVIQALVSKKSITKIGTVVEGCGVNVMLADGSTASIKHTGFQHFNKE